MNTQEQERPDWFSRLDTSFCQERFDEVEAFAKKEGRHEQFMGRLEQLCFGDVDQEDLTRWGKPVDDVRVRLLSDFAPQSFEFYRDYLDGEEWKIYTHGGLIFHGEHDNGGDGGAPTFSVNVRAQDGWAIHT